MNSGEYGGRAEEFQPAAVGREPHFAGGVEAERDDVQKQKAALARERKDVEKRIRRLLAAIELGGSAESLVAKVRELEKRQKDINGELASFRPVPV